MSLVLVKKVISSFPSFFVHCWLWGVWVSPLLSCAVALVRVGRQGYGLGVVIDRFCCGVVDKWGFI
jgi:hypothetical protein